MFITLRKLAKLIPFYCRSTPHPDAYYGGQSDLAGALAWEADGKTTVKFQKNIQPTGKSDHAFQGYNFLA